MKNISKISKVSCLFFLYLLPFSGNGQILNLEKYRADGDTLKNFAFNFNGSFNINNRSAAEDNPVNLLGYNFSLNAIYTPKQHGYIFIGHRNFLRINESPFINFGYLHGRINFYRKERLNFETFIQMSDDNFRGLNPRLIGGGSLRFRLVDEKRSELIIGSGGFYEYEQWMNPINKEQVEVGFIKSTSNIVFRHSFNESLHVNGVFYYQVGYDREIDGFRSRYSSDLNFNAKITKRFSLTTHFDFSYEDRPIVPITRFIYTVRVGVGFDL
jgi:hypothetical protein